MNVLEAASIVGRKSVPKKKSKLHFYIEEYR